MARWQDVVDSEPKFAKTVQAIFDAHRHKTMATIRLNGSPRISGTEMQLVGGEAWLGMMPRSQKLADVRRDPRIAVHSASVDPPEDESQAGDWPGDAKLAGRLIAMDGATKQSLGAADPDGEYFTIDIDELVVTRVGTPADHLDVVLWRPGQPLKTMRA